MYIELDMFVRNRQCKCYVWYISYYYTQLQIEPLVEEDNDEGFQSDSEDLVLTEIETLVAEFNARQRARMVKQSQNNHMVDLPDGSVATLRIEIPPKLRLRTESERLVVHGQYKYPGTVGSPLGHHTTRSASMIMIKTLKAHQRSQRPILYPSRWTRTVEETVAKTSLTLKGTCYWLSKSKRSRHRLPPLAPHSLLVAILSNRPLRLTRKMTRVTLVTVG